MSDVYQALNDVRWLSDRLKGLMTLGQEIESYDSLKDQTAEMSNSLKDMKSQHTAINKGVGELEDLQSKLREDNKKLLEEGNQDYAKIIASAREEAFTIKTKAETEGRSLRTAATEDFNAIKDKIAKSNLELNTLVDSIKKHIDIYNGLKKAIDDLKAKF